MGSSQVFSAEKAMASHSSTLAWKIPWTEEPGRLQSMGSLRVGHDWATSFSLFTFMHWRRKWQPTPVLLPGESQGRGSLMGCRLAAIYGVAQSRTRLKWLNSSSSSSSSKSFLSLCLPLSMRSGFLVTLIYAVTFEPSSIGCPAPKSGWRRKWRGEERCWSVKSPESHFSQRGRALQQREEMV